MNNNTTNDDYNPVSIEDKWVKIWNKNKIFSLKSDKEEQKYYILEMFPYPSGEPHMGHARNYTIGDILARVMARKGHNVLHPIGFDAFGLPAENAAIKKGIHPKDGTMENIEKMRKALKKMAISYDFSDEIVTSEPEYYKWTQWLFLKLFDMGLAEKKEAPVNWCSSCQTVLANEQVVGGKCERCGSIVENRFLSQWFFKTTDYAQRLLDDMELLDGWPDRVLTIQKNWIGRSEGARVDFKLAGDEDLNIPVFTTRPDTLFGVTFFILASEHPLVDRLIKDPERIKEVNSLRKEIKKQTNIDRSSADVEKLGCFTGRYVINPLNGEKIPIWIANYVLMEYGTGAVMAVPGHDERDFDFASKYNIPIKEVISPDGSNHEQLEKAYAGEGIMVNSDSFSGLQSKEGIKKITAYLEERKIGGFEVNYKLKDWLISRQRYWGAPIPIVYCEKCGIVPVDKEDLPVKLPYDVDFKPTGLSPLTYCEEFVNTTCPKCGGRAKRETDTMDTFVCSSWYFLRYCSPHEKDAAFNHDETEYWMPIDQYIGGIEHATMHLIYSRFFTKALNDAGLISFKEPFIKYFPHGVVKLGGKRMSKSKGNIVNPSEIYSKFGADTLRLYILFIGPADSIVDWSDSGVEGASKFLKRYWRIILNNIGQLEKYNKDIASSNTSGSEEALAGLYRDKQLPGFERKLLKKLHQTIEKVTDDILNRFNFNTAISSIMELTNLMYKYDEEVGFENKNIKLLYEVTVKSLILLSPIAPFLTEELWERMGNKKSIHLVGWPDYNRGIAEEELVTVVFQVNGKVRDKMEVKPGLPDDVVKDYAINSSKIKKYLENSTLVKTIVIPDKIVNMVVK